MVEDQYIKLPALPVYEHILSAEPSRMLSRALVLQFLLGDRLFQWAAMWLVGVSLPFWSQGMNADLSCFVFRSHTVTVQGRILTSHKTDWVDASNSYTYAYSDLNGKNHRGVSYGSLPEGQSTVTVEYTKVFPRISRIAGMQTGPADAMLLGMCLPPILGLLLIWASLDRGFKYLRLLRRGIVATGGFKSGAPSARAGLYDVTYEFRTTDGRSVEGRVVDYIAAGRLMNGDTVPILYDPNQPETSVPLGTITTSPEIRSSGEIVLETNGWAVFVFPCLAILAYAVGAYLRFCR